MLKNLPSILLLLVSVFFAATGAYAEDSHSASVSVEPSSGSKWDSFTLSVSFIGDDAAKFDAPRLGDSTHFDVVSSGRSSQLQVVNGEATTRTSFVYTLKPKRAIQPGRYQVPPLSVEAGGQFISLERPHVTILDEKSIPEGSNSDIDFDQQASITTAYVGQQIRYEARVLAHEPTRNAELSDIEFDGFWVEPFPKKEAQVTKTLSNGSKLYVLRKALFPAVPGKLQIPTRTLTTEVQKTLKRRQPRPRQRSPWGIDPFANRWSMFDNLTTYQFVRAELDANTVDIDVQPLPPAPVEDLDYVPVGLVKLASSLENTQLEMGDGTTLKIEILGNANLRPLELNETLSIEDKENFKAYFDKPEIEIITHENQLVTKKTFSIALVPLKAGKLKIPEFEFWCFNPSKGEYYKLAPETRELFVKGAKTDEAFVVSNGVTNSTQLEMPTLEVLGEDLLPQHEGVSTFSSASEISNATFFYALVVLTFFTLFALRLLSHFKLLSSDPSFVARNNALKRAIETLEQEPPLGQEESMKAFRKYLSDRFQIQGESLTTEEISSLVSAKTKSRETESLTSKLVKDFDAGQYGGANRAEGTTFREQTLETIRAIEEDLK